MLSNELEQHIAAEVARRRTFAIISHPDAGKTTLTEKLLLYSGMIRTAGMVRARKGGKATSSDWMGMEQERGISISASAMQFPYKNALINVLDTPGHQDFSEDTYRTLTAADSAIMVLDAAKGVEAQTRKLFAVCRMKRIPILTFINKMDLPGRPALDLLHEVEQVLGIHSSPMNWPIGSGKGFIGVANMYSDEILLFSRAKSGGAEKAITTSTTFAREEERSMDEEHSIDRAVLQEARDDISLQKEAGNPFSREAFLAGEVTPVFFGSALTNFGVEPFFDRFVELASPPRAYTAVGLDGGEITIDPNSSDFTAFVFKIQANMNPKHRDSMAFMRICSGRFERDMVVLHHRSGKEVRLSRSYSLVAQERSTTDVAFPGDVVGVINPGVFSIGDTISQRGGFNFKPIPQFLPEIVAQVRPLDVMRHKAFEKGMHQLSQEGAIQVLRSFENPEGPPLVAAVGRLQFDVLEYRLEDEYGVKTQVEVLPYKSSCYVIGDARKLSKPQSSKLALDNRGRVVLLFSGDWEKRFVLDKNPGYEFPDFLE